MSLRFFALLIAASLVSSCSFPVEVGSPLPMTKVSQVAKGDPQQKILDMFGAPDSKGQNASGHSTWRYLYMAASVPPADNEKPKFQWIEVTFDHLNQVSGIAYEASE